MKEFNWQYSDEKLLLKKHESLISFLLSKWYFFIFLSIFSIVWFFITKYMIQNIIISAVLPIMIIITFIFYLRLLYTNTWIIITTRRVIKFVRNGIFNDHKKELKLADIKATSIKRNFIDTLFGYWNITIQGTEKNSDIYFKGITGYADISNYIWRILDYIKLNWHTDNISKYVKKHERKK